MSRKDDVEDVFFGKSSEKSFEGWTPECSGSSDQPEKSHGCQSCSNTHLSSMPLSSSSFTFTFCVILNLILCQIPRMDTIDAGMPIFCQAFCSDRRNIDIEDILTWPRLKQRRFTARDIPEMVTYQLRNSSGLTLQLFLGTHAIIPILQVSQNSNLGSGGLVAFFQLFSSNPVFIFVYLY